MKLINSCLLLVLAWPLNMTYLMKADHRPVMQNSIFSNMEAGFSSNIYDPAVAETFLFQDDFSADSLGDMPRYWKGSGSGSVATVAGNPGKWLRFSPRTVYKLDTLFDLPENFQITFDLITRSNQAKDIGQMGFGFCRDNAITKYIMGAHNQNAITMTQFNFNNGKINSSSSDTKVANFMEFPLKEYANKLVKVHLEVKGEQMIVRVDDEKILDTKMFNKNAPKHFYISSPFSLKDDALVYFGNFRITA